MGDAAEFFRKLFSTEGFPPRWQCGRWTDFHGWLYIVGDLLIWSAYFAIPLIIVMYISRQRASGLRFQKIYLLFAAFILACGSTHLIDVLIFWQPVYRFSALVRVITGIISWATVFYLVKALPTAFALKSPQALEKEVMQRKAAEQELLEKNGLLATAQSIARLGYWRYDVVAGTVLWSDEMYRIFGMPVGGSISYDQYVAAVYPADRDFAVQNISSALQTGVYPDFHHRIITPAGDVKHLQAAGEAVLDARGAVTGLTGTVQDVTAQRTAELQIIAKSKQLERINTELESFAYIASHDLQEPLRKVLTFSNLLEGELNGSATPDAKLYLEKIALSASRMQRLIRDILQFSRLAQPEDFTQTSLDDTLRQTVADTEVRIAESSARVDVGPLPTIEAVPSQMGQLFSNLLGNALKYAKPGVAPRISVQAKPITGAVFSDAELAQLAYYDAGRSRADWAAMDFCRIEVRDSGIGFEAEYATKIFAIFQRLHGREAYDGTGIGLAVCKKIVENHHGLIEAHGKPGEGATFIITLPLSQETFSEVPAEAAPLIAADGAALAAA